MKKELQDILLQKTGSSVQNRENWVVEGGYAHFSKTSHSGDPAISGVSKPKKGRGAPFGNQRALKTGYYTAPNLALRANITDAIRRARVLVRQVNEATRRPRRKKQP